MLGIYPFNGILLYLKEGNYEQIYNKKNLIVKNIVGNKKYKFIFNHDYETEVSQIINYDFICKRFDIKIKNFKEMLLRESICIFITFSENVDKLKIDEMLDWLSTNKHNFHLIIFTYNTYSVVCNSKFCSIIQLKYDYKDFYNMDKPKKAVIYEDIYEKFINCLHQCGIENDFPLTIKTDV